MKLWKFTKSLSRRKVNFFEMKLDKNRRNILSRRKVNFFGKIFNARLWAIIPQGPARPRGEGVHTPYPDPHMPHISPINGSIFSL